MAHWADDFIGHTNMPLGVVRWCKLCNFGDTIRKVRPGTAGRGWGMREGNKQRGRLIQHIKAAHPDKKP